MICPKCGTQNAPSVRQCAGCGAFLPDESNPEYSDMKQDDIQVQNVQPAPAMPEQSRYQEITMSDVAARKSHKKLIIWLVVAALVIALGVATFFIVKAIIGSSKTNDIKNDPTSYVFGSYQTVAKGLTDNAKVIKTAVSAPTGQKTIKSRMTADKYSTSTVYSIDSDARKFYYAQTADYDPSAFNGYAPQGFSAQLLATPEKAVAKAEIGGKTVDYYLELDGLREKALSSAFGPEGENILHIDRATYDMAMDVYDFIYNNVFKNSDPFSLSTLGQKLKDDFDTCGNITVTDEKVTVDGTEVDAHVVSHTFTNADIVTAVITDIKTWLKDQASFNAQVSKYLEDALAKFDPATLVSQITAQGPFELSFKHYINDNDQLMKAEIRFIANGTGGSLNLSLGADPANAKQITLTISAIMSGQGEMTIETASLKNESTDAQDKYVITLSGLAVSGEISYTRDISTGDFTVKGEIKNGMAGIMQNSVSADNQSQNSSDSFELSGNLKTDDKGTVSLSYTQKLYDGSDMKYEITTSPTAEIPELTSQNDILKASSSELMQVFGGMSGQTTMPVETVPAAVPQGTLINE